MELNKSKMLEVVRKQLAIDMNCKEEDFIKEGVVFCEAKLNEERRMFERQSPFLEVTTIGKGIVVSGDKEILSKVRPMLENKTRDDIFSAPFLYGHSLYYLPDSDKIKKLPLPEGFDYYTKENSNLLH